MSRSHDELIPLAPAYVVGALEPDERRAFAEHLSACAICAAEIRSLARVALGLAQTVPQLSPRPELRSRLLTTVGATVVPRRTMVAAPVVKKPSALATWLPHAAVLVLAAGFGLYAWDQRGRMRNLEARLERADAAVRTADADLADARRVALDAQTAIAVLTAQDLARIDLAGQPAAPQASALALWSRQRGMVFSATNLPPLPGGRVYQVWIVTTANEAISAGLVTPDAGGRGTGIFMTSPDIGMPAAVAVTIEPAGGVPAPTGDRYLVGLASL